MSPRLQQTLSKVCELPDREQDAIAGLIEVKLHKGYYTQDHNIQIAHRFIRMILLVEWDPIGIFGEPKTEDEYDRYIPAIYQLLRQGTSQEQLVEHLSQVQREKMEIRPNRLSVNLTAIKLFWFWNMFTQGEISRQAISSPP